MWLRLISSCLDVNAPPASRGHLRTVALGWNCLQDYNSKKKLMLIHVTVASAEMLQNGTGIMVQGWADSAAGGFNLMMTTYRRGGGGGQHCSKSLPEDHGDSVHQHGSRTKRNKMLHCPRRL